MVDVSSPGLRIRIEWLDGQGVSTPELAATWARYEIWAGSACVTEVVGSGPDSTPRRSVFGSLYPLAEWLVSNWWLLKEDIGPSRHAAAQWNWSRLPRHPWLIGHNFRAAGEGMSWPDLTLVPEGAVTRVRWVRDTGTLLSGLRFTSSDDLFLPPDDVTSGLAEFVNAVVDRLAEQDVRKTRLAEDWAALGRLDQEDLDFCLSAARLGINPFTVSEEQEQGIVAVAAAVPAEIAADFFPSLWRADGLVPESILAAARWAGEAALVAANAAAGAEASLSALREAVAPARPDRAAPPWRWGYRMARRVRQSIQLGPDQALPSLPWVNQKAHVAAPSDLQGVVTVRSERVGLTPGHPDLSARTARFRQARAMGRALMDSGRTGFVLSPVGSSSEQAARAFAAELLAPAEGIEVMLGSYPDESDAVERAAEHFAVSSAVVLRQIENQLEG